MAAGVINNMNWLVTMVRNEMIYGQKGYITGVRKYNGRVKNSRRERYFG